MAWKELYRIYEAQVNGEPWDTEAVNQLGVRVFTIPPEAIAACEYLESQGLEFLVHFGVNNAFEMALAVLEYGPAEVLSWHGNPSWYMRKNPWG